MPNTSYRVFGTTETYSSLVTPASGEDEATIATITGGNPLSQTTWVVSDAVEEYLDIGDIAAKGRLGNGAWQAMTITSRDAASGTITLSESPSTAGYNSFRLYRKTQTEPLVNFVDGARLTESDLDKAYRQGLFAAQEVAEDAEGIGNLSTANLTLNGTTTVTNLNVTGTVTGISNTPAFLAKMSADQDIPDASDTKVQFDTEVYDTDGKYDHSTNYRFTPTVAGTYFLYAQVHMLGHDNSQIVDSFIFIKKNGTALYASRFNPSNNYTNQHTLSLQVTDVANTTDYYEVFVYIDDLTATPDIDQTTSRGDLSFFGAYKLIGA